MIKSIRERRKQAEEAEQYAADMQRFREWLLTHPRHCDPEVRRAAISWTEMQYAEMQREKKNARLAGRTSLRNRLKNLVTLILSQNVGMVKAASRDASLPN